MDQRVYEEVKVKVKWSHHRPSVAQRVGRGIALLFHGRSTKRGWVVSSTSRPHFTPGKDPVPIVQEAGWAPGIWRGKHCKFFNNLHFLLHNWWQNCQLIKSKMLFYSLQHLDWLWDPLSWWVPGTLYLPAKAAGCEPENWPPSSPKLKTLGDPPLLTHVLCGTVQLRTQTPVPLL